MRAAEHTQRMLQGWRLAQTHRIDLAIRRQNGAMLWQMDLALEDLPIPWARAENVRGADIYIRPARGHHWAMVFLDDVPVPVARQMALEYGAMAIQTSPQGGCHIWLPCDRILKEEARCSLQRTLADRYQADKGSVSGEHLGRLAGFRNWKRGGCWVNVLCEMDATLKFCAPQEMPVLLAEKPPSQTKPTTRAYSGDVSPSGIEWGWVCRLLETGHDPEVVYQMLVDRAINRRGNDVERYARRTVEKAVQHVKRPR